MPAAMGRRLLMLAIAFVLTVFVARSFFGNMYAMPRRIAIGPLPSPAARSVSSATEAPIAAASPTATAHAEVPPRVPNAPVPSGSFDVAIIIDDCGQWLDTERGFLDLPIPLTMSVLPHVRYTAQIAQEAAAAGKGVMLHLPMEPLGRDTAGRGEITTAMTDDQVIAKTEDAVAQV